MIEQHVAWNDDIGEWQLKCVAYTGNNMRKQTPQPDKDKEKVGMDNQCRTLNFDAPHYLYNVEYSHATPPT